ncbi:MAG TPA: 2,3-diaminopropionate biosynthesis protein SbnA [Pyrinomonadaceae bacterium]|nr:2,3-diaminopropionate biosynthesis protein SbnA [Pyrinomonadaceae bacterium]
MEEGILSAIGNTPLIRLTKVVKDRPKRVYAKLESLNPGGSMKDRPAFHIIRQGVESGLIPPGTVVVESSSGNMGVGLAQVCSYYGLRFICVVDPKTTTQNILLLRAYGAEVDMVTEPDPQSREYLQARINRVRQLCAEIKNSYWPNQYANRCNAEAHRRTVREIIASLGGRLDYLFCATSTCGTLRGCAEYLREQKMATRIYAVDAVGSVIFGGQKAKRLIPGHGAAIRPDLYHPDLADECIQVTDLDCVVGCRRLARFEAVLAGGSSGGVLTAFDRVRDDLDPEGTCVLILPDRGERYLDTIYSDTWVQEHYGDVSHRWELAAEEQACVTVTS